MRDNICYNLHKKESQLAFAMGVFETKIEYGIGDDDAIFDEFIERLYEISEYNIHHRAWIQEMLERIYDEDNLLVDDIDVYEEYEEACEKFKQIESFIERGCVAI